MVTVSACEYFTNVLQGYNVDTIFGIVGIPIVELADVMINKGIKFIGCRNEQAASYAASAYGYLTGRPGVLLVVGGPGLIHALAGVYNSMSNRWPLIVIAGSSEDNHKGGFQELDQISLLNGYLKFTGRLQADKNVIDLITYNAVRHASLGASGVTYIDFPGNIIGETVKVDKHLNSPSFDKIKCSPDPAVIQRVTDLILKNGDKKILVVMGKGAVENSDEIRTLIDLFGLPFLPTPMAKGIVPDSHPLNVSSARSQVLRESDIVIVLGARLNWILHFAEPPKWKADAIFIQVDENAEAIGQNNARGLQYGLFGDVGLTVDALTVSLKSGNFRYDGLPPEWQRTIEKNQRKLLLKELQPPNSQKLNYNQVYHTLRPLIEDENSILVTEGANTMDIARISFPTDYPKHRLDAGTNATMGIGLGYGIAAKVAHPHKDVILVQGDSAFGFSAMELETSVRYNLGLVVIVMNNSGIYHGVAPELQPLRAPSTALSSECRYDLVGKGLGANGFLVRNLDELEKAFKQALLSSRSTHRSSVINVIIEPGKQSKLSFGWQTKRTQHL
ncbi:hypothetical protein HG535_0B03790 [Zygotorulaspora mrakii]|uniref:2-hydroxyacyl-CoA lyase n=1 Tax=Zygotorulaspora mrakii TaxID=42260 RepID=A0A7H9B028_ZYGMR|nr:uncharacterized protein HG535_0B03790 [Zygotorulaspora mrakii]QLG71339.1 hypothetical protein HG535_0B03790 [Zygotorulaspora mrakii]